MAGARARDTNPANPISQRSRVGMLPRSISRRSRSWADRLTLVGARPRSAEAVDKIDRQHWLVTARYPQLVHWRSLVPIRLRLRYHIARASPGFAQDASDILADDAEHE